MLIESIIKRPEGTKVEFDTKTYHFKPDDDGRHVAEVEETDHISRLLSIRDGFRPANGEVAALVGGLGEQFDGPYFIVRGPQDARALTHWVQSIPEMSDFDQFDQMLLVDKIALGEASLGDFPIVEFVEPPAIPDPASPPGEFAPPPSETSPRPPADNTILPIHGQHDGGGAETGDAGDAGDGGADAADGVGAESTDEDEGGEDGGLDREALAKEYDELFGHRPNGKWKPDKIKAVLDAKKAEG
ncbi:hypothetical protein LWE61_15005 [Sphingobium sufflavum]|uniref:hypothetical protein n=1 Tax=Sphingobium sufflavum TaxID=1129547 RepID=UPI001F3142B0|nr:hypothetical protein [Sphingobium sufflavum]MCE7797859.1 hypothetical protein [Sphingobium sufflavum]